jgi:aldehyde:ferredoxin oxidoreductase
MTELPTPYQGRILRINLTKNKVAKEHLANTLIRHYLGGKGIGTRLLFDELKPDTDPLGPENKLIFATGPATGTIMPHKGHIVCYKSPLTGIYGSSSSGGFFADELKQAGYDILVVEGRAEKPLYLWISDENVELKSAAHLWGRNTFETNNMLKEELGDEEIKVARIGVAGEKLVRFASITNDYSRMAGRCGPGAVMGSKNLKAIAVRGTSAVEVAKIDDLIEFMKQFLKAVKETPATAVSYPTWGTAGGIDGANLQGVFPTRYWHKGMLEGYEKINGETIRRRIVVKDKACHTCPVNCSKMVQVKEGSYTGTVLEGPDYETLYSLGGLVEINDVNFIVKANEVCDRLGIDTMAAGNVVALAMDCYDKGILTRKDMDDVELIFGNKEALIQMLEKIGYRDSFGNILAEGVKEAARIIGKGAEKLAVHVKGLEPAGYDPRGMKGCALGFAVSDRGACHMTGSIYTYEMRGTIDRLVYKGKPAFLKDLEDRFAVCDTMVFCRFLRDVTPWDTIKQVIPLVAGFELKEAELKAVGERIVDLARAFNVREGIRRKDDCWPERFYKEPLPDGGSKGQVIDRDEFDKMLDEYYELRGWDKNGVPRKEKLQKLKLENTLMKEKKET